LSEQIRVCHKYAIWEVLVFSMPRCTRVACQNAQSSSILGCSRSASSASTMNHHAARKTPSKIWSPNGHALGPPSLDASTPPRSCSPPSREKTEAGHLVSSDVKCDPPTHPCFRYSSFDPLEQCVAHNHTLTGLAKGLAFHKVTAP
jgi:hypothetical protein